MDSLSRTKFKKPVSAAVLILEFLLATLVVLGTAWYLFISLDVLIADSGMPALFFSDLINIFLSAVIGIEVARVLITHNLMGIFEILALVMARKVLDPDVTAVEVLLVSVSFAVLVFVRGFLLKQDRESEDKVFEETAAK